MHVIQDAQSRPVSIKRSFVSSAGVAGSLLALLIDGRQETLFLFCVADPLLTQSWPATVVSGHVLQLTEGHADLWCARWAQGVKMEVRVLFEVRSDHAPATVLLWICLDLTRINFSVYPWNWNDNARTMWMGPLVVMKLQGINTWICSSPSALQSFSGSLAHCLCVLSTTSLFCFALTVSSCLSAETVSCFQQKKLLQTQGAALAQHQNDGQLQLVNTEEHLAATKPQTSSGVCREQKQRWS